MRINHVIKTDQWHAVPPIRLLRILSCAYKTHSGTQWHNGAVVSLCISLNLNTNPNPNPKPYTVIITEF